MKSKLGFVFLFFFLFYLLEFAEEYYRPLIYFTLQNDPNTDMSLKKEISTELKISVVDHLVIGENTLKKFKFVILNGSPPRVMPSFSQVYILFEFIVKNSVHKKGPFLEFQEYNKQLFYESKPIFLTCGKISLYFIYILVNQIKLPRKLVRLTHMYDLRFSVKQKPRKAHYIIGQHTALEICFQDINTWVLLDLNKGVMATLNTKPTSLYALNRAKEDEINLIPVGLDKYGKGRQSAKRTNEYYKDARNCFGFKRKKIFHVLFTYENKALVHLFSDRYIKAYGKDLVIYTSPDAFFSSFY